MSDELVSVIFDDAGEKMDKALSHVRAEFATVRTGRATPALVERIIVEAYGEEMMMQQLASFTVPEARQLLIIPFDKSNIAAIEKAIQHSDLGLNPSSDGNSLRLVFPPLTEERRKQLVKVVRNMAEEGRITIRNMRRDARRELDNLKRDGDLSEDDLARAEKELDQITQRQEAEIDKALETKVTELLEV